MLLGHYVGQAGPHSGLVKAGQVDLRASLPGCGYLEILHLNSKEAVY